MPRNSTQAVMFEMLRSFATLAQTLNLSQTVKTLGITRQTVRRHINTLEKLKGIPLFRIRDRRYFLTEEGQQAVKGAEAILGWTDSWITQPQLRIFGSGGLDRAAFRDAKGHDFHGEQHPLSRIWKDSPPLVQKGFHAWSDAQFQLEGAALEPIRPYCVIYRKHPDGWILVNVGEKSSYATWLGWEWAKSSIGKLSRDDPTGTEFDRFVSQSYTEVYEEGGVRLDHVYAHIPRHEHGSPLAVSFQRLLMGCTFPDGDFALAVLVARTNRIAITGLDPKKITALPEEMLMEYEP
jgi:biotin operon repressor